jgi:hypothetical protein
LEEVTSEHDDDEVIDEQDMELVELTTRNLERAIQARLREMPDAVAAWYVARVMKEGWNTDIDSETGEVTVRIGGRPFLVSSVYQLSEGRVRHEMPPMMSHTMS